MTEQEPWPAEGGDSACWMAQVCPECSAFKDSPSDTCWRCGTQPQES